MALKIEPNQSATAFHITDGPWVFPYAIDAQHAISNHPAEWSDTPWSQADTAAARKDSGLPEVELTPEDQAAIDEHNKAVAEAAQRLADYRKKKEEERLVEMQVAADEALVASPAPRPDPDARKPLTGAQIRKAAATLSPDEQAAKDAADKKAEAEADAKKAASDKAVADKKAADTLAGNTSAAI